MHKILLIFFLSIVFFFPKAEVFADISECSPTRSDLEATGFVAKTENCAPDPVCFKIYTPGVYECFRVKVAAAGAGGGTTTNNTSGGGQRCTPGAPTVTTTGPGIMTAIGCIPTEPKAFVEGLLKYGTVAAGAIAFILMLLGALGLITAEGNPEAIKASQERFYSAIIGLLFIIFAVLLMQVIGVDILGLPGFGR